jgi:lysozyme
LVIHGIDVSHHQGSTLDFSRFRQESGIEFAFLKATEGAGFVDSEFTNNLRRAKAAGMLVAAYHYQRADASIGDQVANVRHLVPLECPVILDVEANSGSVAMTRGLVEALNLTGYRVPLSYIPRWYWQQIGSPDLRGLPPLWSSRYPDNLPGSPADEYADVPASYWAGYGGLSVAVLQYTSSGRIPGYSGNLDLNAYQGTRAGLQALLYGMQPAEGTMRNLIIGKKGDEIWVGDGLTRRKLTDMAEVEGLQYWIGQSGGNKTINDFSDLRVLGVEYKDPAAPTPVDLDYDRFVLDVVDRLKAELSAKLTTSWSAD